MDNLSNKITNYQIFKNKFFVIQTGLNDKKTGNDIAIYPELIIAVVQ